MTRTHSDDPHTSRCESHGLVIDEHAREVFVNGRYITLTRTEFDLLLLLERHPRRVLTAEFLLSELWRSDFVDDGHPIEVYIHRLRRKLGESGRRAKYIHTVRGVGYRFEPDQCDGAHIRLVYDGQGVLREIRPALARLWGRSVSQLIGTAFNPVDAVVGSSGADSGQDPDGLWEIHVSRPSNSSS